MGLRASTSAGASVHGQLKLARLLEQPERDLAARVRELEGDALFKRLVASGVVRLEADSAARIAARRMGGFGLRTSSEGLGDALDAGGELAQLISRVGQEDFVEVFLRGDGLSDEERARRCAVTLPQARALRELVNKLYVQEELEGPSAPAAPALVFSAVAGVAVDAGKPVLAFFHRDVWKGRYQIDERKQRELARSLPPGEARRMETLVRELEFMERRKSTLFRLLELLLESQSEYLVSGDPDRRKPLTQRAVASELGADPSVINRLVSNKSVEMPWGLELPLSALMPSSKKVLLDRLHALALENPGLSDDGLRAELAARFGKELSRRSIAQYRQDLGLPGRGLRKP